MGSVIDALLVSKYERLQQVIGDLAPVAVAFSGGADSSLLLGAAVTATGKPVAALFADSALLKSEERSSAQETALALGGRFQVQALDPLSWPEFVANPPDRCYHCKKKIYSLFLATLPAGHCLLDGAHTDDLGEDRPGLRAARELGVRSPLIAAGLGKQEVRLLSRRLELPTWNRLSSSCLATRIPAGSEITADRLLLVNSCEDQLSRAGFLGCRVRLSGLSVRIELCETDLARFVGSKAMAETRDYMCSLGVEKVFLDLNGRPGIEVDADFP